MSEAPVKGRRETLEARIELALALLRRSEAFSEALSRFREAFPAAPQSMLETAAFHIYIDGADAALDWLADAESFLRGDVSEPDMGKAWHLLYHIYNWSQFHDLLPIANDDVLTELNELKVLAAEKDWDAVKRGIDDLFESFEGSRMPPHLGH